MDHPPDQRATKRRQRNEENTKLNFIQTGNLKNEMKIKNENNKNKQNYKITNMNKNNIKFPYKNVNIFHIKILKLHINFHTKFPSK